MDYFKQGKGGDEKDKEVVLDDTFAKGLGYPSMEEFKNFIKRQMELDKERQNRADIENQIVENLLKKVKITTPQSLVNKQLERRVEELVNRMKSQKLPEEEIKKKEKGHRKSLLDGVPRNLPSLLRAHRLQERAARVGFDWSRIDEALVKLDEELEEFKGSLKQGNADDIEEELGDIYFMLVNIARMLTLNPEDALKKAISKFIHRFRYMEEWAGATGKALSDMTIDEMEKLWQESKRHQ